jgi:type III secretion protein C
MGQAPGEGAAVRVVVLKYAWAKDVTVSQGGQERVIPGVASVMTQLHGGGGGSGPVSLPATASSRSTLDKLRGMGLAVNGGSNSARERSPETDIDSTNTTRVVSEGGSPRFTADGRLNAVLIRDLPERLDALEATVRALDTRPGLVEIEVRIIEVNADEAESLGVDWRLRGSRLDVQVGQTGGQSLGFGSALSGGVPGAGRLAGSSAPPLGGGVLTTVLGDAGRFLIARVNLLAQEGKANLLSSPKVMTLDNVEAVMEDLSTFFVRVQGNLDVDLFNVSAGTSLRVTPLIVEDGANQQQVKLAIRIEDGAVTAQSVDGVPIVRRSVITTQSLIKDGQALLIAGYARESQSDAKAGVPGLSDVPVAGWLFKNTEKRKTRVERFFLLTPRVVMP